MSSEENKEELTKEGFLKQQSKYLKQFKKRFVILKENHLFCYTNEKKTEITQLIDLSIFKKAQLSKNWKSVNQFELVPNNDIDKTSVFEADKINDVDEWISIINQSIEANAIITHTTS